jgi:hypothetical protein
LLDNVISSATGQTLNSYINQKLKLPTGMNGAFYKLDFDNLFISTPRSMARFGLLILNKGKWSSTQVMTDSNYFNQMVNTSQQLNKSYGYLWWLNGKSSYMAPTVQTIFNGKLLPSAPNDLIAALGKNGQIINIIPSQNIVLIRMGNAPNGNEVPFMMNDTIWQKMNRLVCNSTYTNAIKQEKNIVIYPNPAKENITIQYENIYFDVELFDIIGNKITSKSSCFNSEKINTKDFKNGIYFLRIISDKKVIGYKKIIISD